MEAWVVWIVAAVALLIAEATTAAFVAIYFGLAAVVAAALAAAGASLAIQLLGFAALSVGSLTLTRPALRRAIRQTPGVRTGVDAMQGRIGVVTRAIGDLESGQVKVGGEMWTARCFFDGEPLAEGTRVEVVRIEGVTALVIAAPSPHPEHSLEEGTDG
jgi:membrane protein implicated in regulation of membrane protease activity